jgi:hypothetical protein
MLVVFEVGSARPVARVLIDVEGDGEPGLAINFEGRQPGDPDARYFRAVAFKPVVNGTWPLRITAWTDQGCGSMTDGSHKVTVVF